LILSLRTSRGVRPTYVLHILASTHPIACIAEFDRAIPSAPSARAFAKSDGVLNPPVIIKVT